MYGSVLFCILLDERKNFHELGRQRKKNGGKSKGSVKSFAQISLQSLE